VFALTTLLAMSACAGDGPDEEEDDETLFGDADTDADADADSDADLDTDTDIPPVIASVELVWSKTGLSGNVMGVGVSAEADVVVAASNGREIAGWNLAGDRNFDDVWSDPEWLDLELSPDGTSLIAGGDYDNGGQILDSRTGALIAEVACLGNNGITGVAWSARGDFVAVTATNGSIGSEPEYCLFETESWDTLIEFGGDVGYDYDDVAFTPSGDILGVLGDEWLSAQNVYTDDNGFVDTGLDILLRGRLTWLDEDVFAFASYDEDFVYLGSLSEPTGFGWWFEQAGVTNLAVSPDGNFMAMTLEDGTLAIASLATRDGWVWEEIPHAAGAYSVRWSEDGNYLVSGGSQPSVALWHVVYE
jgi:WD40 repeat protein